MEPEVQDHGFAFFAAIEKEMNVLIADHLKNLLIFNGYNNNISLSHLTEDDIPDLELFAKNLLPDLIKGSRTSEYFGLFKNNVDQFQILSGEKKLLLFIADHLKNKLEHFKSVEMSTHYDSDGQAAKQIKYEHSDDGNDDSNLMVTETEEEDEVTIDLTGSDFHHEDSTSSEALKFAMEKQNMRLTQSYRRLIRNFAIKYQLTEITEELINNLKTEIQCKTWPPSLDAITGLAKCIICHRIIKIQKTKNGWIYSNFGKHFLLHMKPDRDTARPLSYQQPTL